MTAVLLPMVLSLTASLTSPSPAADLAPLAQPTVRLVRAIPTESGRSDVGACVLPIDDGGLLAGWTSKAGGPADGLLVRVNGEGEVLWRRTLGGEGTDLLWAAIPDGTGGFVCPGFTSSGSAGGTDGWIIAIDRDGATRWEKRFGGAGDERFNQMRPARGGGWMLAGESRVSGGDTQAWVLRLDAGFQPRASWTWGGAGTDRGFGIEPLADGGCVLVGMSGENRESARSFAVRFDSTGREAWVWRGESPGIQVAYDIEPLTVGGHLVVGYGYAGKDRDRDGFAVRLSADGRRTGETRVGGATYDRIDHARVLADGSVLLLGYSQRPGAPDDEHGWDMTLYAIDPNGKLRWTGRFGGDGTEFARGIAGDARDVWLLGHTTTGRDGSALLLVRLDVTPALAAP